MKKFAIILSIMICTCILLFPLLGYAVETSPRISDREIIESLIRLEEGVKENRRMIVALRAEMGSLRGEMGSLRTEMRSGNKALRDELLGFMKWGFGLLFYWNVDFGGFYSLGSEEHSQTG